MTAPDQAKGPMRTNTSQTRGVSRSWGLFACALVFACGDNGGDAAAGATVNDASVTQRADAARDADGGTVADAAREPSREAVAAAAEVANVLHAGSRTDRDPQHHPDA